MSEEHAAAAPLPLTLEHLYRANVRAIYAYIYTHVGNRETAEDITSEVFVKALAHLDPTRTEASTIAWLYRVAHNAVNDYWRGRQKTPVIPLDEARVLRNPAPIRAALQHEQSAARATSLLAQLPENYRAVLTFRLLQGLSVAETALRMGISEGNVKVLQHRALKRAAELREDQR